MVPLFYKASGVNSPNLHKNQVTYFCVRNVPSLHTFYEVRIWHSCNDVLIKSKQTRTQINLLSRFSKSMHKDLTYTWDYEDLNNIHKIIPVMELCKKNKKKNIRSEHSGSQSGCRFKFGRCDLWTVRSLRPPPPTCPRGKHLTPGLQGEKCPLLFILTWEIWRTVPKKTKKKHGRLLLKMQQILVIPCMQYIFMYPSYLSTFIMISKAWGQ